MTDPQQPPVSPEHQKWLHEMSREDHSRVHARYDGIVDQLNEAAIKTADGALRAGLLINGGAAVSVLAFIGSLATKELITVGQLASVADSLLIFAIGVATAVAGMGLSYLTHFFGAGRVHSFTRLAVPPYVTTGPKTKRYTIMTAIVHILAFVAGFACIGLFILGMFSVRYAIVHLSVH
jgi:hypothetical protein